MITNERIVSYLHSLEKGNGDFLDNLRVYAEANNVPIIRKEMESFLKVMIDLRKPSSILEIGTAIGYSSIFMAMSSEETCHITTIENYDKRIPVAKGNFVKAGMDERITLMEGDALDKLKELVDNKAKFDMVFIDAAKSWYMEYLMEVFKLTEPGALIISDNVLQEGELSESRYAIERRNRTIHGKMREFLYNIKNMKNLDTTIIPLGDGVAMSWRKQ